ncbi:MAG: alpha/beta hydrolase [Bryobacteraceae bacterium]
MTSDFTHKFVPSNGSGMTLLLLHGTGGDENDLLPIGRALAPGAALLSPRGKVLEHGMPRFFRRLSEGVFDLEDVRFRANELAEFVREAAREYRFDPAGIFALGYSNGANIAAVELLMHPDLLAGAVLFRSMFAFEPEKIPRLDATPVLMVSGRHDPVATPAAAERLAALLAGAGAKVEVQWRESGHELTPEDFQAGKKWLAEYL